MLLVREFVFLGLRPKIKENLNYLLVAHFNSCKISQVLVLFRRDYDRHGYDSHDNADKEHLVSVTIVSVFA